jgi:meiotically up-regulated gene 157 (Mug157) protein
MENSHQNQHIWQAEGVGIMKVPPSIRAFTESIRDSQRKALCQAIFERFFEDAVTYLPDKTAFISTGDIPAMWLRDSSWQLRPLLHFLDDPEVRDLVLAVQKRQLAFIDIDPYANAFNISANDNCWQKDFIDQSPWVFERKFELDSLSTVLDLSLRIFARGISDHLDEQFAKTVEIILSVIEKEQKHDAESYVFIRKNVPSYDFLSHAGKGAPFSYTGMVWSAFRPSDDACTFNFHIPDNLHLARCLIDISRISDKVFDYPAIKSLCQIKAEEILSGVKKFGIITIDGLQQFAYEVDGLGNFELADDANVPSLLALPYLDVCESSDPLYLATRDRIWSSQNSNFYVGTWGEGIGSIHTEKESIWPLSLSIKELTSTTKINLDSIESVAFLRNAIPESVNKDDLSQFTREWFSWADMTYVESVIASLSSQE